MSQRLGTVGTVRNVPFHLPMFLLVLVASGFGQQAKPGQTDTQDAPSTPMKTQRKKVKSESGESRLFGIVPTYSMTNTKDAPALTPGGKFKIFVQNATDPLMPVGSALVAGIGQATNEFSAWGQGASGYGKRFGGALADSSIGEFLGTFLLPTMLHEDPRYFRDGVHPFKQRVGHALSSAFVARKDSGRRGVGWSILLGELAAGGISNAYYPPENRGVGLVFPRAAIGVGLGTVGTVFNEFGPDIQRKMFRKKTTTSRAPEVSPQ